MPYLSKHQQHLKEQSLYTSSVFQMENERGSIEVTVCDVCHYMTAVCNHEKNTWLAGGTALICDLCGDEGT